MHVKIAQKTNHVTSGWLFKSTRTVFVVACTVTLTDEERETITKLNLWDHTIYEYPNPRFALENEWYEHDLTAPQGSFAYGRAVPPKATVRATIRQFCQGTHAREFASPGAASKFAEELRSHVKNLKDTIDHGAGTEPKIDTFDL